MKSMRWVPSHTSEGWICFCSSIVHGDKNPALEENLSGLHSLFPTLPSELLPSVQNSERGSASNAMDVERSNIGVLVPIPR